MSKKGSPGSTRSRHLYSCRGRGPIEHRVQKGKSTEGTEKKKRPPQKVAATQTCPVTYHGWVMDSGLTRASNSSPERKPSFMAASRRLVFSWCAVLATLAALS